MLIRSPAVIWTHSKKGTPAPHRWPDCPVCFDTGVQFFASRTAVS